jgi:glycerol uptake facilitator-like aquaporin
VSAFLLLFVAALGGALKLWNTYCENFGCTGLGIAWFFWAAALYAPALVLGVIAWRSADPGSTLRLAVSGTLGVHVIAGAVLAAYWAAHLPS